MLDSIYVGLTGMTGYSMGLNVISNNVANLNSPGFKGAQLQFSDLYYKDAETAMGAGLPSQVGNGLQLGGTFLNFQQGEARDTGNDLDVMIDGAGLFVLRKDGATVYARAGQFEVNDEGLLVDKASGARVAALTPGGALADISVNGARFSLARPTTRVELAGNLSVSDNQHVISDLTVYDQGGNARQLKLTFEPVDAATQSWKVTVAQADGTAIATGEVRFDGARPAPGASGIQVAHHPEGGVPLDFTLQLSGDATSMTGGTESTLQVRTADGRGLGSLVKTSFDADGYFTLGYSNGEVVRHEQLALAWFGSPDQLEQLGGNQFAFRDGISPRLGHARQDGFGVLRGGAVEMSNVDLAKQFSELIVTQRGYQACSQAITTANEMLQMLMDLRGKR